MTTKGFCDWLQAFLSLPQNATLDHRAVQAIKEQLDLAIQTDNTLPLPNWNPPVAPIKYVRDERGPYQSTDPEGEFVDGRTLDEMFRDSRESIMRDIADQANVEPLCTCDRPDPHSFSPDPDDGCFWGKPEFKESGYSGGYDGHASEQEFATMQEFAAAAAVSIPITFNHDGSHGSGLARGGLIR